MLDPVELPYCVTYVLEAEVVHARATNPMVITAASRIMFDITALMARLDFSRFRNFGFVAFTVLKAHIVARALYIVSSYIINVLN